ncbi:MAG: hydrogen peroxide-inducible genes activator [Alphaproteobacteria bacterium]|nr:hydrogen peroxide-inducible genes activator [Alphaproteobacteria bacterium]
MINLPTLKQLRYLTALADAGHFGRAAEACHVGQSTLSAGIGELEEILGAALVDRTSRKVVFTPLGEATVKRARTILELAEDLAQAAQAAAEPLSGPLRLGVIPTIGPFLLPGLLPRLRQAFPKLQLYLREDLTHRLVADLESGRLDLALLALPCDCGAAATRPLFRDPFHLVCRADHPLAGLARIPAGRLAREPLLLLEDGHCLRDQALAACRLAQAPARREVEATSLLTLVQMAGNGLGLTLVPEMALKAGILGGTDLVARPFDDEDGARIIGLAWRKGTRRAGEFELLARAMAGSAGARERVL